MLREGRSPFTHQLFLCDQAEKQFHSWAEERHITTEEKGQWVTDLRWEDARWFCAWLSTQPNLAPDGGVYDYRLPTSEEIQHPVGAMHSGKTSLRDTETSRPNASPLQPWTTDPQRPGNALRVVRQRIPDRYRELINYLASGRWKEADQETDQLMHKAAGEKYVEDAPKAAIARLLFWFKCDRP